MLEKILYILYIDYKYIEYKIYNHSIYYDYIVKYNSERTSLY
jgi:hypothetical protein